MPASLFAERRDRAFWLPYLWGFLAVCPDAFTEYAAVVLITTQLENVLDVVELLNFDECALAQLLLGVVHVLMRHRCPQLRG